MTTTGKTFDVFVAVPHGHDEVVRPILAACRATGLEAFTIGQASAEEDWRDAVWEALTESRAILMLVPPEGPTSEMLVELGAAAAWNKPVFVVLIDPRTTRLPPAFEHAQVFPTDRIDDLLRSLKEAEQLDDLDRQQLADAYAKLATPVDQIAANPSHLETLTRRFQSLTGKPVAGEVLLSELLRMRKQGQLPRTRSASTSRR